MKTKIDEITLILTQSVAQLSRGGYTFIGDKRTKKRNFLRFFGSSDKNNYKPGILIMN